MSQNLVLEGLSTPAGATFQMIQGIYNELAVMESAISSLQVLAADLLPVSCGASNQGSSGELFVLPKDIRTGYPLLSMVSGQNDVSITMKNLPDLTGAATTFIMVDEEGNPVSGISGSSVTVTQTSPGIVTFGTWGNTSALSGRYRSRFKIVLANGDTHYTDPPIIVQFTSV